MQPSAISKPALKLKATKLGTASSDTRFGYAVLLHHFSRLDILHPCWEQDVDCVGSNTLSMSSLTLFSECTSVATAVC